MVKGRTRPLLLLLLRLADLNAENDRDGTLNACVVPIIHERAVATATAATAAAACPDGEASPFRSNLRFIVAGRPGR